MDKTIFSIYLGNPDNDNGTPLDLPAKPWAMRDALEKLRLRDGLNAAIAGLVRSLDGFGKELDSG